MLHARWRLSFGLGALLLVHGVSSRAGEPFTADDITSFNETVGAAGRTVQDLLEPLTGERLRIEARADREKMCFELGALVQRLHRSSEQVSDRWRMPVESSGDGSGDQDPIVRDLNAIARDAMCLPSFCGGAAPKATLLAQPVPRGDLERLREKLTELQEKLNKLSSSLSKKVTK